MDTSPPVLDFQSHPQDSSIAIEGIDYAWFGKSLSSHVAVGKQHGCFFHLQAAFYSMESFFVIHCLVPLLGIAICQYQNEYKVPGCISKSTGKPSISASGRLADLGMDLPSLGSSRGNLHPFLYLRLNYLMNLYQSRSSPLPCPLICIKKRTGEQGGSTLTQIQKITLQLSSTSQGFPKPNSIRKRSVKEQQDFPWAQGVPYHDVHSISNASYPSISITCSHYICNRGQKSTKFWNLSFHFSVEYMENQTAGKCPEKLHCPGS